MGSIMECRLWLAFLLGLTTVFQNAQVTQAKLYSNNFPDLQTDNHPRGREGLADNNQGFVEAFKSELARLTENNKESSLNSDTNRFQMPVFPTKPAAGQSMAGMPGMTDAHGRVQMGVASKLCDDGKTNLTTDWDFSSVNYTCFHPETRFPFDPSTRHIQECMKYVNPDYRPNHFCMDQQISYSDEISTLGDHRPLWPVYGEYLFVPRQRWLHNIEHGAVIMLYHPCAQPEEVKRLKSLVQGCFDKHVITPSTFLTPERPLALVAWGCRLLMATVEDDVVVKFIQDKSMKGPEDTTKEGQYTFGLLKAANSEGTAQYNTVKCRIQGSM